MDRSLFERAVKLHGFELDRLVTEEQGASFVDDASEATDSANATSAPSDASAAHTPKSVKRKEDRRRSKDKSEGSHFSKKLHDFIARKADLLFRKRDDGETPIKEFPSATDAEKSDYYAILPPLEQFLRVHPDVSQERLFELLKVGDVVIGQILSTKEFGIFIKLLALCQDMSRFLEECEVVALLPAGELRDKFSHVASVEDFQIGDLVRALVIKVNAEEQKVIISLHARDDSKDDRPLGLISEAELPVHYRRSVLQLDSQEMYQDMLHNTVGFDNPFNVAYLGAQLRLSDDHPLSLMRGLQSENFPEKEFAEPLRKWQTSRWSMESVAKGVEYFKAGQLLDAMQHLNKALEIDEENVEALVARGALYANKDLLSKALQDFSKALKIKPNHRNANKYMCQTLIERGKQLEEMEEMEKAADCYQTAIDIKPDFLEAQLCLSKIKKTWTSTKKAASPESISSSSPTSAGITHMSVEALRQLVEPEKRDPQPAKKSAEKTKKKKKKKEKEKGRLSRKGDIEEKLPGKSQSKSYKKKRKYSSSSSYSSESSETSRSRSRSRQRSRKKRSRVERKSERSTSKRRRKDARKRSLRSASYSRSSSSSSGRSTSQMSRSRSRSHQQSGRKDAKHSKKHRSRASASYSSGSSSDSSLTVQSGRHRSRSTSRSKNRRSSKQRSVGVATKHEKVSSSKQRSQDVKDKSHIASRRSWSTYSGSDSSYSSEPPERSKQRSDLRSHDYMRRRSSKDERYQERSSRQTKTGARSRSPSSSPKSRHRTLSLGTTSRGSKPDMVKTHSPQSSLRKGETDADVQDKTKESVRSRSKSDSRDGSHNFTRVERRDKSTTEETHSSKQKKPEELAIVKSPKNREQDIKRSQDVTDATSRLEKVSAKRDTEKVGKMKQKEYGEHAKETLLKTAAGSKRSGTKGDRKTTSRHSHADTDRSSDERSTDKKKQHKKSDSHYSLMSSTSGKVKDSMKSKEHKLYGQDTIKERGNRDRKSPLGRDGDRHRSRSRSFSSDRSSSGRSYSSYSVSGSRSYSYSSYSSYSSSESYSDSDDSYHRRKEVECKPDRSRRHSEQQEKASREVRQKGQSELKEKDKERDEQENEDDEDSDSDVDTGIYEISRDHLEMYLESKSYEMKKIRDESPLKGRKRWRSGDEKETVSDKKSKLAKKRKISSDDEKEEKMTPVLFPAAYKESEEVAKSPEYPVDLDPTLKSKSKGDPLQEGDSKFSPSTLSPPPVCPSRDLDDVSSIKTEDPSVQASYIRSLVPNVPFIQSSEPDIAHHESVVPDVHSLQSIVPCIGSFQTVGYEDPNQSIVHDEATHQSTEGNTVRQQQLLLPKGLNQSSLSSTVYHELGAAHKSDLNTEAAPHQTVSKTVGGKLNVPDPSQQEIFTPEQLTVIQSISKQLARTHPSTSHMTLAEKTFHTDMAQYDLKQEKGHDVTKDERSLEVANQAEGHHIGVIVTQRSNETFQSNRYQEMDPPQSTERTKPTFDNQNVRKRRGRWDVMTLDERLDRGSESGHHGGIGAPPDESKPAMVSFDYKHGQNISASSDTFRDITTKAIQETGIVASERSRDLACDQPESCSVRTHSLEDSSVVASRGEHQDGDRVRDNLLDTEDHTRKEHEHSRTESLEILARNSHRSSRGERYDEIPRGKRPEGRSHYDGTATRHHYEEGESKSLEIGHQVNVDQNLRTTKVQVVDYQHGKRERHHERSRMLSDKNSSDRYRCEDRHHARHGDRHRSPHDRHCDRHEHRERNEHRLGDRRHSQNRDRYQSRDRHSDRHHRRSSEAHGDRSHSRTQRSRTPVEPKESNPFFQLTSLSKDMQVASLHSEGKWGHDYSPEEARSSHRTWWL